MVTKGRCANILEVCSSAETANGQIVDIASVQERIQQHFKEFSSKGFRTLGIAYRDHGIRINHYQEPRSGMTFLGFLVLFDPPKARYRGDHRPA